MDRRDNVLKAIHRTGPEYVPLFYFNADREDSDIIMADVVRHYMGPSRDRSEWGFTWERADETMGQPTAPLLTDFEDLPKIAVPDPFDPSRFEDLRKERRKYGSDRFYLASLVLSGFTTMTLIYGFEAVMTSLLTDIEHLSRLADLVFGFEEAIIKQIPAYQYDGVAFFDDWGTQNALMISPDLWRRFFRPRYERQFTAVHEAGMYVYFHSCGYYPQIIPDLIDIGVDLLNISQPNLYDIESLGREFGGKVCFVCPVSYQTTGITGTRDDIYSDVTRLVEHLGRFDGGLIGYVEEYHSIGMPPENYRWCCEAFRELGGYRQVS